MSDQRKYLGDFLLNLLAQGLLALRPLVFIPFISRFMGAEAYGLWSQVLVSAYLLAPLMTLMLQSPMTRFLSGATDDKAIAGSASALLACCAGVGGLTVLAGWLAQGPLAEAVFGSRQFADHIVPMLVYSAVLGLLNALPTYFLIVGRARMAGGLRILWVLGDAVLVVLLAPSVGLVELIHWMVLWQVVLVSALSAHIFIRHGLARPKLPMTREFWLFALMVGLGHVLFFWAGYGGRYVLVALTDVTAVALLNAGFTLASVILLINAANINALLPAISAHWNAGRGDLARPLVQAAYKLVFVLGLPMAAGLYFYGNALLAILSDRALTMPGWMILMLCASSVLWAVYFVANYALWMQKRTHVSLLINVAGVAVNLALAVLLVGPMGIAGAALAMLASMALMTVWTYLLSKGVFAAGIDWAHAGRCALACGVMALALLALGGPLPLDPSTEPLGRMLWKVAASAAAGLAVYALAAVMVGAMPARQVRQAVSLALRRTPQDRQPPGQQGPPAAQV